MTVCLVVCAELRVLSLSLSLSLSVKEGRSTFGGVARISAKFFKGIIKGK